MAAALAIADLASARAPGPPDLTQAAVGSWVPAAARVGKCGKCQAAWQVLVWPLDPR